jgi:hypothetical protein
VIDGAPWTGDVLCLSEWLSAESRAPFRALLARGDFVRVLAGRSDCELRLLPVQVVIGVHHLHLAAPADLGSSRRRPGHTPTRRLAVR